MKEYMYSSQKKISEKKLQSISPKQKREIDKAISNCVIEDCLPFGAFRKNGMLKVLNLLAPGFINLSKGKQFLGDFLINIKNILRC